MGDRGGSTLVPLFLEFLVSRTDAFVDRHIGPSSADVEHMLATVGVASIDELIDQTIPAAIRDDTLDLPEAVSEAQVLAELSELAEQNQVMHSLIGLGYHGTITPPVIVRNVLENPAWYTAYTPYQPEISQGRLEALLNFQTIIAELCGLDLANASLLDEPTAAAEAMTLLRRIHQGDGATFLIDPDLHPQTRSVIETRAEPLGIRLIEHDGDFAVQPIDEDAFGGIWQYTTTYGAIRDLPAIGAAMTDAGLPVAVVADPLSLVSLEAPGEFGVDVVVGSAQRFGVPMAFGGPHAGFMAIRETYRRSLPGRLVGVSVDSEGNPAYRLALQTREQHIRREKATSNICTAQVLLANIAGLYACWHGPDGLRQIAERVHDYAARFHAAARAATIDTHSDAFFDTVTLSTPSKADEFLAAAVAKGINVRRIDADTLSVCFDETVTEEVFDALLDAFDLQDQGPTSSTIPPAVARSTPFGTHEVFNRYHSETAMMRYVRRLSDRDLALDRSMIPLGSCTMKLNAAVEMESISWPAFAAIHPFAPLSQARGYLKMIDQLEAALIAVTGYHSVSLQPNAGSQGELAGLLAIRSYHRSRGDGQRSVCLIPSSAHGTNAASAVMAGMSVSVVECDENGNIDIDDLNEKIAAAGDTLAAIMVTYPSTHGVFETEITEICDRVHAGGGQVYLDGANLNAMIGYSKPGRFGADVSHLNLHKTFCIPHGGGGPGIGPVAVGEHLAPFLPNHPLVPEAGPDSGIGPISGAPWGSAGILPISWSYVRLMGPSGLREATGQAILSANYIAKRLEDLYPVLYTGSHGRVAHECILDTRPLKASTGITVDDLAKRLIDYGFHAPTMSFPVAGTLMVEPTESEDLAELDRFIDAMRAIHSETQLVADGTWPADDNPLVGAPHTQRMVCRDDWARSYGREEAAYPLASLHDDKYWSPVGRIDGAYGDKNLVCSCPDLSTYMDTDNPV